MVVSVVGITIVTLVVSIEDVVVDVVSDVSTGGKAVVIVAGIADVDVIAVDVVVCLVVGGIIKSLLGSTNVNGSCL